MTDMTDGKINLSCGEPHDYWIYDTMTDMTDVFPNFIKSTMVCRHPSTASPVDAKIKFEKSSVISVMCHEPA